MATDWPNMCTLWVLRLIICKLTKLVLFTSFAYLLSWLSNFKMLSPFKYLWLFKKNLTSTCFEHKYKLFIRKRCGFEVTCLLSQWKENSEAAGRRQGELKLHDGEGVVERRLMCQMTHIFATRVRITSLLLRSKQIIKKIFLWITRSISVRSLNPFHSKRTSFKPRI